ncbi:hypothetical protein A2Z33_00595 [Candidatus Gottesmanbacteria bacterium RBG_16_52_11]|uniref:Uncharacterized protein n=1 Tax=Candidatus Gottesmanbacteria bacterium RBG_16_52_11 TaxID=1798374 RepID=A0A1F5YMW1_9BACT|nr:MAG: hypothetical protein A2Z33_00595 [Candidatus Gottesmanbacteria bacterium RBG_16_52_11]
MRNADAQASIWFHPLILAVTAVKFAAAATILVNPFWGLFLSSAIDIADAQIVIRLLGFDRRQYQQWDKSTDWFAYVAELWVGVTYGVFLPLFLLLFFRFFGQFMFSRFRSTLVFILFPNFFEAAFMWLVIFHPDRRSISLGAGEPWNWLYIFFAAKLIQEIMLHYVWTELIVGAGRKRLLHS